MRITVGFAELIFLSLLLLFFLGLAGVFYLIFGKKAPPMPPSAEKQITFQEVAETSQPEELNEEVIKRAQEAILLAQQVISQAEQFLAEKERQKIEEQKKEEEEQIGEQAKIFEKTEEGNAKNAKGIYMTGLIATSQSSAAISKRQELVNLILKTELNAIVIDVKEVEGPYVLSSYQDLIDELHQRGIWTIARIVVFADASLIQEHLDWYCKTKSGTLWQDRGRRYWLDPGNKEVQQYIIEFSKKVIDIGFDELQFDYIRFPANGNLEDLVCLASAGKNKSEIIGDFAQKLAADLKAYKPDIVLSVDLFGLLAVKKELPAIGQRVLDFVKTFDYISFMLYPSHFYLGFEVPADPSRNLPTLYFPYEAADASQVVSSHPYEVVWRSLLFASDYLASLGSDARLRPWLQDFTLKFDTGRGILYDAQKVKLQIRAAEDAGISSWLLWNPENVYTREALGP